MFLEFFFLEVICFVNKKNENQEDNNVLPSFLTDGTFKKSNKNIKERKITLFANLKKTEKNKLDKKKNTMIYEIKKTLQDCLIILKNPIYLLIIFKRSIITFVLQIVYSYFKQ